MLRMNIFKIKEGKLQDWMDWCRLIEFEYRKDAIEVLREKGLRYEGWRLFSVGNDYYAIGFATGKHLDVDVDKVLYRKHKAIKKECLEYVGPMKKLYEIFLPKSA